MHVNLVDIQYLYIDSEIMKLLSVPYPEVGARRGGGTRGGLACTVQCALYPGQAASSRRKVSQCC